MPVVSHEVYPLFIEPYFRASIAGSISPAQIGFIKKLKMVNNPENMISENLYIFEEPELKSIKDAVQDVLDIYARDVLCVPQRIYVTQSWSLICMPNSGMHGHSHSNSVLSGSLYVIATCPIRPAAWSLPGMSPISRSSCRRTRTNATSTIHLSTASRSKPNDVLLFSSRLTHLVEPNTSRQPRHSIAFNTFVKGQLGDYRAVTELKL